MSGWRSTASPPALAATRCGSNTRAASRATGRGCDAPDTLKKAIANGALLTAHDERHPYVVLTSHLPETGSGTAMLAAAIRLRYLTDVVCVYSPPDTQRLHTL